MPTTVIACDCGKVAVLESPRRAATDPVEWTKPRAGVCPNCHRFDYFLAKALGHLPGINPCSTQGGRPQPTPIPAGTAGSTSAPATRHEAA